MMTFNRIRHALVASVALLALFLPASPAWSAKEVKSHMDKIVNSFGCAGCHSGLGAPGTPLLRDSIDKVCFSCHGKNTKDRSSIDIESVLSRSSVHPLETTSVYHRFGEQLPEENSTAPRHVACVDCHVVHVSTPETPTKGSGGYDPGSVRGLSSSGNMLGTRKKLAENGYEICYKCHSDSANLPSASRNISIEFDSENASYHPVEAAGKNSKVPSLVSSLRETDTIACADCHGNDDSYGAKGPHGSDSSPLLVGRYQTEDGPESEPAYELCYMCHDRKSILKDESYKRHNYHIVAYQTSCYTCHASHGTASYEHLISFNPEVVSASVNSAGPYYYPSSTGSPKCYLYCHGVDHWSSGIGNRAWPW